LFGFFIFQQHFFPVVVVLQSFVLNVLHCFRHPASPWYDSVFEP
jgi:hypothetical protein